MRHRLKINGVTYIELKCEEGFQNNVKENKHLIAKLCNINIINTNRNILYFDYSYVSWVHDIIFQENPSTLNSDTAM